MLRQAVNLFELFLFQIIEQIFHGRLSAEVLRTTLWNLFLESAAAAAVMSYLIRSLRHYTMWIVETVFGWYESYGTVRLRHDVCDTFAFMFHVVIDFSYCR